MSKVFVTTDANDVVIGFYPSDVYAEVPAGSIEIKAEDYKALRAGQRPTTQMKVFADGTCANVELPPPPLATVCATQCKRIDDAADAARLAVAGDPLRAAEYQLAEAEAKGYQATGFTGDCPPSIRSWAEAKNWTAKQAAENILAEAAAWNAGLYAIRDARLKAKEAVRNASMADAATAIADAAIAGINAKVANLGNAAG